MLLVIGSRFDGQASQLLERCRAVGLAAELVTPADLSRPGWRFRDGPDVELAAGLAAGVVPGRDITAVVTLLPWVTVHELPHIASTDREYVADEIGAFLLAWLHQIQCPVLDRPSPRSLCGCGRGSGEWAAIAATLGIKADPNWQGVRHEITVLNGASIGAPTSIARFASAAEAMAVSAGRSFVTLWFADVPTVPCFVGVPVRPAVDDPSVAEALLGWLACQ